MIFVTWSVLPFLILPVTCSTMASEPLDGLKTLLLALGGVYISWLLFPFLKIKKKFYYFFGLCWIFFVALHGLSLVVASGDVGVQASPGGGSSCYRAWALDLMSSVVLVHELSYPKACGIFPDQGPNPCLLHWQVNSSPLSLGETPASLFFLLFPPIKILR